MKLMKPTFHQHPRRLTSVTRLAGVLLAGILLLGTVSCGKRDKESWLPFGKKESACEKAFGTLETQFKDLKASITGRQTSADRAAFWQATAALFIVLSGFALVGGAALGSRARRDQGQFQQEASQPDPESDPEPTEEPAV
jgi:hypothetical protein